MRPARRAPGPLPLLHAALEFLHALALRRPMVTLSVTLLAAASLAAQVPRMRVLLSIADLDEARLPSTARNRQLREAFQVGNSVAVVLRPAAPDATFTSADIERIRDWIVAERSENPELVRAVSPFGLVRPVGEGGRRRSAPLLEMGTAEELRLLLETPWAGILTDRSARDIAVEFAFRDTPGGSRYGSFDPSVVGSLERSCLAQVAVVGGNVRAHVTGVAAFQYHALEGIRRFRVLNLAILAFVLLAFRALFGTWRSGVLMIGVLVIAGLAVFGSMSLAGAPIDFLSTGLFLMLSVAALEDFLFLSCQQLERGTPWRDLFAEMLVPGFLTSLTTAIGFGSLCVSDLSMIRRFGAWAAAGSMVEWAVTFLVLPTFLQVVPATGTWTDPARAWRPALLSRLASHSLPRRAAVLLLGIYGLGALGAVSLKSSDSVATLFSENHPYRQGLEYLERSRGFVADISVVFPDARRRDENEKALERLVAHRNVAAVLDPYEVLAFFSGGQPGPYYELIERGVYPTGKLGSMFADDGRTRALLYLKDVGLEQMNETVRAVEQACQEAGCLPAGDLVSYAEFANRVPSVLFKSLATSLLLVGLILVGLLAASGHGRPFPVLAASFWGPAFMLAALWGLRVPLNFLTCVFASVLVGLTGDNTIQFLYARHGGRITRGIRRRGAASVQVALIMGLSCLVFLGSSFVPSRRLGAMLAVGFIASLAGDIWILRGLLDPPNSSNGRGAAPTRTVPTSTQ